MTKGETNAVNGRQIGIKDVNAGKVSFKGIEKIYVDSSEALDGKGLDYLNKSGAKEIKVHNNLTLENKDGGTLDLGKIKYDKKLTIKGGIVEGKVVDLATINALAALPNHDGMLSMFLSVLQAPVSSFARVVKAVADSRPDEGAQTAA